MQNWKPHVALFIVNLIYAANYTIAKIALPAFVKPFGFILIRVSCALFLYAIINEIFFKQKIDRKDFPRLIACGIFGVATNQLLFFLGLSMTTAINASLIMITTPILVLVMSALILKERITSFKIGGIALGALGAFLVIRGEGFALSGNTWKGDICIMLNAASYAVYLVIVKPLMAKYHPLTVIKWVFFFGLFPVIIAGWRQFGEVDWTAMNQDYLFSLLYVVLMATFAVYLLNIFALRAANPSLVGIYIYLQPILASAIAIIFSDERLNALKLFAAALIFIGVYLVSLKSAPRKQAV